MKKFQRKTIVLTGAGSGIGQGLAKQLASLGASLALADINKAGLEDTLRQLPNGCDARVYELDVSKRSAVEALAEQVVQDFGAVHGIINNAGVALSQTVEDMTYEDFDWVMDIDFWGVVYGTKAFLPLIKQNPGGFIVNISSIFGLIGVPTQSAYNAAKFAVRGFTEALKAEMKDTDIDIICVHPGGIKTNIAKSARFYKAVDGGTDREQALGDFDRLTHTTPDQAAARIVKAIKKGEKRVLVGPDATLVDYMQRFMPDWYTRILNTFFNMPLKKKTG